jgi:4-amino-4-deoxy-L-arabinose transferase-like glycosyltransferase
MNADGSLPYAPAPAPPPQPSAARRLVALVLVVSVVAAAWAGLQLYGLSRTPFHTKGEPREAIVVQDLVRHGNWILPRRNGVQLPRKPPLYYWLAGAVAQVRGNVDEVTARLPSVLVSGAACVLVAAVATVLYGGVAGVAAGLTLLTSFEWMRAAIVARVDMTLAFGLTLVFVGLLLYRRCERGLWLLLVYGGCAWATLSKGIPGLAIPVLQVLLLCLLVDRSFAFAWRLRPLSGLLAVLIVCGSWYVAAALQGGRSFVTIAVNENLVRAVGSRDFSLGHEHSVFYLLGSLAAGLLPWTVFLPSVGWALWRARRTIDRRDPRLFALLWIAVVFAPYAVATSKRSVYLLPLYPAVALLLGWFGAELVRGQLAVRWLRPVLMVFGWGLAVIAGVLALSAGAHLLGLPVLDSIAPLLDARAAADVRRIARAASGGNAELSILLAGACAAGIVLAIAAMLRRWGVALAAIVACTAALTIAIRTIILPAVGQGYTRRQFAEALRRTVGEPSRIAISGLDYGTLFYWGAAIPSYDPNRDPEPPPYLLLSETDWVHMTPLERRRYRRVAGLTIPRANNQGYLAVLERIDPDADADTEPVERE